MAGKSRNKRKRIRARNSTKAAQKTNQETAPKEEIPSTESLEENTVEQLPIVEEAEQDKIVFPIEIEITGQNAVKEIMCSLEHVKIDEELTPTEMASVLAAVQKISSSIEIVNGEEAEQNVTTIILDITVPVDTDGISNALENVKISEEDELDDLPIDLTVAKTKPTNITDDLAKAPDDPSFVQEFDEMEEMYVAQEDSEEASHENVEMLEEDELDDLPIDLTVSKKESTDDLAEAKDDPTFVQKPDDKEELDTFIENTGEEVPIFEEETTQMEFNFPDEYFEEEPDKASKKPPENEEIPDTYLTDDTLQEPSTSAEESPATRAKKHVFRDPDSYQEFTPQKFTIQVDDTSSSDSSVKAPKALPRLREHPPHSFLVTIDTVLMILECTLAGAYRISQQCTGPTIPLVVANTMQSVRLALETLKVHFSYTRQQSFEPLASILRELLFPAVELFAFICPELTFPDVQFYHPHDENRFNTPNSYEGSFENMLRARQIPGMVFFPPHPVPIPKGPPRIALFMDNNRDPNLGAFATADGFIRIQLPSTFQIDLTIDGGICVRNFRDKVIACISACGNFSALATTMVRVHQHNLVTDVRITDEYESKNMFAKMGVRGIQFGGTGCPQNAHLRDDGTLSTTDSIFSDMNPNFIRDVFINHTKNGPEQYEYCCDALKDCKTKTLNDGSLHFHWKDIKITQYSNGEIIISRNHWNFMIWCAPEVPHIKKGVIKIVTPISRIVTTVINNPEVHKEKYFLVNLGQMWVYYTARDYIVSNEVYSAGYNSENNSEDYLLDEAAGYQQQE